LDLIERADDLDSELLRRVLMRHESGVSVLMGPYHPEDAERIPAEATSGYFAVRIAQDKKTMTVFIRAAGGRYDVAGAERKRE